MRIWKFCGQYAMLATLFIGLNVTPIWSQETEESQASSDSVSPVVAALTPFVESGEMLGFVTIVATKDEILDFSVVGYADVDAKKLMEKETRFWIASMTKTITSVAVMMMVDEGKISLDDPVSKYFPEFENVRVEIPQENGEILLRKATSVPTIRQVMSHTAGWKFTTPYFTRFRPDALPLDRKAFLIAETPLQFNPGEKYSYSNMGIDVGAAIVEKVSGQKFEDFCQKRIFEPLGMTHTTWFPTTEDVANTAVSYAWNGELKKLVNCEASLLTYPLEQWSNRFSDGGSGVFSTANDMTQFYRMLLNRGEYQGKRLLSEAAVAELDRKQTGDQTSDLYGLGTFLSADGGAEWFGHGGAYATDGKVWNQKGCVTVYMVQAAGIPKQNDAKAAFDRAAEAVMNQVKK